MKYAKISGDIVTTISLDVPRKRVEIDGETQVVEDLDGWVQVKDDVFAGYIDNGDGTFTAPPLSAPTADQVKAEAERRILAIVPEWKQRNMITFGVEAIRDHGSDASSWPVELQAMNTTVQDIWNRIKTIRTRSDEIETMKPIPADFMDDKYWL